MGVLLLVDEEADDRWGFVVAWVAPAAGVAVLVADLCGAEWNLTTRRSGVGFAVPFGDGPELWLA